MLAKSVYTTVSLDSKAQFWVVNGVTTTFPTPFPQSISLGTESIYRTAQSNYIIGDPPVPANRPQPLRYTMSPGGPPVTILHNLVSVDPPREPQCILEKPPSIPCTGCAINGDTVQIFWFPPKTNVTRDMCATAPLGNGATVRPPTNYTWTPITTGPYTVYKGNTWYSGNVYLSLNRISAQCFAGEGPKIGRNHDGEIFTMAPSELSSYRFFMFGSKAAGMIAQAYSFNFDDLVSPYPWSALNGIDCVLLNKCIPINGPYNPMLAVPDAIRRLDPSWSTCEVGLRGLYDPPTALTAVGNIFATLTSKDPSQLPTPGQPARQSEASSTVAPNKPPSNDWPTDDPPTNIPPVNTPAKGNPLPNNDPPANDPGVTPAPAPTTIGNIGGSPVIINPTRPGEINIGTQLLKLGDLATVIGGALVSMEDPFHMVVSSPGVPAPSTLLVPPAAGVRPAPTTAGVVGGSPVIVNPVDPGAVIVGASKTLTAGGQPVVVDGTTMSLIDPSHLVVSTPGQAPVTMTLPAANAAIPAAGAIIKLPNGETVTATDVPGLGFMVSGTFLGAGGAPATLPNGIVLSEAPSGTGIVVIDPSTGATSTFPYSFVPGTGDPTSVASGDPNIKEFTGAVSTLRGAFWGKWWVYGWMIIMVCMDGGVIII